MLPLVDFTSGLEGPAWGAMDDVIMGGVSSSSLRWSREDAAAAFSGESRAERWQVLAGAVVAAAVAAAGMEATPPYVLRELVLHTPASTLLDCSCDIL